MLQLKKPCSIKEQCPYKLCSVIRQDKRAQPFKTVNLNSLLNYQQHVHPEIIIFYGVKNSNSLEVTKTLDGFLSFYMIHNSD